MSQPQRRYPVSVPIGGGWAECLHTWESHECMVRVSEEHQTHRCACGAVLGKDAA
jgi:hypothetical protein